MITIYSINYRNRFCLEYQYKTLRAFCNDPYKLVIIDSNGDNDLVDSQFKKRFCEDNNLELYVLPNDLNKDYIANSSAMTSNCSAILGNKLNYIYQNIVKKDQPQYFAFLDQDFFAFSQFELIPTLDKMGMYGDVLERHSDGAWVLHPWLSFYKYDFVKNYNLDFRPCNGFDTGGSNWNSFVKPANLNKNDYWVRDNTIMYFPFYNHSQHGPQMYEKEYFEYNGKNIYGQVQIYDKKFIHMLNSAHLDDPFNPKTSWCKGFLDAAILFSKKIPFTTEEGFRNTGPGRGI